MSSNDYPPQDRPNPILYVSTIDVSLAKDSRKTIGSIKVKKNNESPKHVAIHVVRAGSGHREELHPPLALEPDDHISVSVNCSWRSLLLKRVADIFIDISPHDIGCMRDEQGVRSYRKKERKVEVVVTGFHHHQLLATTTSIIQSCERFRLLIIGNSGVGKTSLIHKVFGVEGVHPSEADRGIADINQSFISTTNERFVVHDSLGFEAGDEENIEIVKDFVDRRMAMPQLKDQLHAIWLCLETPYAGGRLLEGGAEKFLRRRKEILGEIPLVVVLTKVDQLDMQLELDLPANGNLEQYKSRYLDKYCTGPLHKAAGCEITHVAVSVHEGYSGLLSNLFSAMDENMAKYHVNEAPRVIASIAQRISIEEKIESSITIGKKKYWNTLLNSSVFRGHSLKECIQVIYKDVVTVWNFNDPHQCLMDNRIIEELLRTDNLGETSEASSSNMTSFASFLVSNLESLKRHWGSKDIKLSVAGLIEGAVIAVAQNMYEAYQEAKKDVKILMAYIVDLICVMQAIFLLASGDRVTADTINLVLRAYEGPRRSVHRLVDDFDGKLGVLSGGPDHVLDRIEKLIWRYSIGDHEIEELRGRISQVLPSASASS